VFFNEIVRYLYGFRFLEAISGSFQCSFRYGLIGPSAAFIVLMRSSNPIIYVNSGVSGMVSSINSAASQRILGLLKPSVVEIKALLNAQTTRHYLL